jgi:hypothetical protein
MAAVARGFGDDEDDTAAFRAPNNRVLLDAMMRQIQSDLRALAPTEIAYLPPPATYAPNPFLVPWTEGDPPLPWSTKAPNPRKPKNQAHTTKRTRKGTVVASRHVRRVALVAAGLALLLLIPMSMSQPQKQAVMTRLLGRFTFYGKAWVAALDPTTTTITTGDPTYEPMAKVPPSESRVILPASRRSGRSLSTSSSLGRP